MLQDSSCGWKTPRNTLIAICFSESVRCMCVGWGGGEKGKFNKIGSNQFE